MPTYRGFLAPFVFIVTRKPCHMCLVDYLPPQICVHRCTTKHPRVFHRVAGLRSPRRAHLRSGRFDCEVVRSREPKRPSRHMPASLRKTFATGKNSRLPSRSSSWHTVGDVGDQKHPHTLSVILFGSGHLMSSKGLFHETIQYWEMGC